MNRVFVTGLGCICSLGPDVQTVWTAMTEGLCGIGPLSVKGPAPLRATIAAEVREFDPGSLPAGDSLARLDRFAQFALLAGTEAIADAGLEFDEATGLRTGVLLGTAIGGLQTQDDGYRKLYLEGGTRVHPLSVPRVMLNAGVSALSMAFGIRGPGLAVSSACSSSNHAIAQAMAMIRTGQIDVAITGGSDAPLTYGHVRAWEALRVLAPDACQPFSLERKGLTLGEGAGVIVLESEAHARRRGARIYAELAGSGMTCDAGDLLLPDADGAHRAIAAALADGGIAADEVDYINAHGTGTVANDANETVAVHRAFGPHAGRLAISSTKSMHGHALGAAGGIEAVATALALFRSTLPPTVNFGSPDPKCDLDYVPNQARQRTLRAALSNSFAFGGLNAVLAFRAFSG